MRMDLAPPGHNQMARALGKVVERQNWPQMDAD
jgi:hypothetical protein